MHDRDQAADRGVPGLLQRVLAERRRDVGALDRVELDRQRARLEDEREVLRLRQRRHAGDLGAAAGRVDPARVLLVVDRRERVDLVVEHDREALEVVVPKRLPAHRLGPGDVVEDLVAVAGELHRHDRLAGRRVEVLLRPRQLQVLARHLRVRALRVLRVDAVLEEVVVGDARDRRRDAGADHGDRGVALDHDRPGRDGQHLRPLSAPLPLPP